MRKEILADGIELYLGDCRDVMPILGNVDAIITDPPYPAEFEYLYEDIAKFGASLLPIGGSLVALCGHYQVPSITAAMSRHLRYWWIAGMLHHSKVRFPGKWVSICWKPAVWFVKERRKPNDYECPLDMLNGGGKDKEHHDWGQPVNWFEHWISRLTTPGDIVLDPCMGAGTTGVAAVRNNRKFTGIEIDPIHFDTSCRRISETLNQPMLLLDGVA